MKLRNKKTGEIVEPCGINLINGRAFVRFDDGKGTFKFEARSLAELNEEWEDYEEPEDFWFIDPEILIGCESTDPLLCDKKVAIETMKQIGNYFNTREEAEKAVEKLKAWKQLKDKGFRLNHWKEAQLRPNMSCVAITGNMKVDEEAKADLDLLFGGEA